MSQLSMQAVVTGKVQGVGFRAATVRQAGKLDPSHGSCPWHALTNHYRVRNTSNHA